MARKKTSNIGRWSIFLITLGSFIGFVLYTMKQNQGSQKLQQVSGYEAFDKTTVAEAL